MFDRIRQWWAVWFGDRHYPPTRIERLVNGAPYYPPGDCGVPWKPDGRGGWYREVKR